MNDRQRRFAELVVQGIPAGRAYEQAGYKVRGDQADANAARLKGNDRVSAYIAELREAAREEAVMSLRRKREWLTKAIRTPLSEIDAGSEYCAEYTVDEIGAEVVRTKKKKVDPLRAIDILNRLDGNYAAQKRQLGHHVGRGALVEMLRAGQ